MGFDINEISKLAKKDCHYKARQDPEKIQSRLTPYKEPTTALLRKKGTKRSKLSNKDIISIAYQYIVKHEKQADIAKEMRVTNAWVSQVVAKFLKNKKLLDVMKEKEDHKEEREI